MATEKKPTTRKATGTSQTKKAESKSSETQVQMVPKQVDLHEYIPVVNGSIGKLVYISPRTGERFVWEELGDVQEMELQELRNAKAANKKFFEKNWFLFDDDYAWVVDYLGVGAFYRNAIGIDEFDTLFKKKPAAIKKIISGLSDGQKRSVAYKAMEMIASRQIDSMNVVDLLEESLGLALVER